MNLSTKGILRGWRGILNDIEPWNLSDFRPFFKLKAIACWLLLLTIIPGQPCLVTDYLRALWNSSVKTLLEIKCAGAGASE